MEMTESESLAALVATVAALKEEVHQLRQDIQRRDEQYLTRLEFTAWKTGLEGDVAALQKDHEREVADRKAARAPWWSIVAAATGVAAVALTIILNLNLSA